MATMLVVSDRDLGSSAVLNRTELGPCLRGSGATTLWCGNCGTVLTEGVDPERVCDLVFRCPCGAYNRPIVRPADERAGPGAQPPL